jgi:multidrug efflux pump subunit AcrA (membrane-fusion protein)
MSLLSKVLRGALPVVILAVGAVATNALIKSRPTPAKEPIVNQGVLVEVARVASSRQHLRVQAQGTVVPARQVALQPEVNGRIVWRAPEFVPGGRFVKGALLLRIDVSDYALQLEQRKASAEQAEHQLQIEKSRKAIASREWEIIGEEGSATAEGKAVALREPQLKSAEAVLRAAESAAALAKLAASRTAIRAPYNGFVKGGTADVGQLVSPGMVLAELVGSDEFWVQVAIPVDVLAAVAVPGVNAEAGEGAVVHVEQKLGERGLKREGRVLRLLGDLDPVGRMARLLVSIDDPLRAGAPDDPGTESVLAKPRDLALPLLLGAYVQVEIEGRELVDVVEVPRVALREGNRVLVYGKGDRLEVREVAVVWRKPDSVLVTRGVSAGEEVIVSRLGTSVEGVKLRKVSRQAAPAGSVSRKETP